MKKNFIYLLLLLLVSGCLKNDELNKAFESFTPKEINDGLNISNPSAENIDSNALINIYRSVYEDDNLWSLRSLLVFRNGKLVSESYMKDDNDITTRHLIWSCTKQVMAILLGIAIDEGRFSSLDDPISDYFTFELSGHEDKSSITLRNLITMQSGIDYNNDGAGGETDKLLRQIPDNMVDFILSRPINASQGTLFHYNDGNPHLLSALIQKVSGKPTDIWADEALFSKIGFRNYYWDRYIDGITFGGYGLVTTPRELAKIALCVADTGRWNSDQVIPREWVIDMTSQQVDPEGNYKFGYFWWLDKTRGIHFMWGHGGQFAFIDPSKKLLVVFTSIPNTQGDHQINADEALEVVDRIVAACN